jgi:hypothetical protein
VNNNSSIPAVIHKQDFDSIQPRQLHYIVSLAVLVPASGGPQAINAGTCYWFNR